MQTHLDAWIQTSVTNMRPTDMDLPRSLTEYMVALHKAAQSTPLAEMTDHQRIVTNTVGLIVKMLVRHEGYDPLGIQLTPDLAQDFHGAKAPEVDDWIEVMREHRIVYVDIPDGLYPHDFRFEWRSYTASLVGVLMEMTHLDPERFKIIMFFKEPGPHTFDKGCEFMLQTGPDFRFDRLVDKNDVRPYTKEDDAVADLHRIAEEMSHIVRLALLYHKSGEGERKALPRLSREQQRKLSPHKQKQEHQKRSLFRVARYQTPANRFERKDQESPVGGGWKLGVTSRVRGHFRWQAHGPRWSLRRLQYIPPHYRGHGDERVDLVRLTAKE